MPIVTLSESLLLRTIPGNPRILRDSLLRGFCLKVGRKSLSFLVATSVKGEQFRYTIGRWPYVSLQDARAQAFGMLAECRMGRRPVKATFKPLPTLEVMLVEYVAAKSLRASSEARYRSVLQTHFAAWLACPVSDLGTQGFVDCCFAFAQSKGAALVEVGRGLIGALIKYANAVYGLSVKNPFVGFAAAGLMPARAKPRQRKLQERDLNRWHEAVMTLPALQRDYLLFTLYTGLRRAEAGGLLFANCDGSTGVLVIPETKNKRPHRLPITPAMLEILNRRRAAGGERVFEGLSLEHIADMAIRAGAPQFMLHDLRKMFATVAEKNGVRDAALRFMLNHVAKKSDVLNRHYIQLGPDDVREELMQVQGYISAHWVCKAA